MNPERIPLSLYVHMPWCVKKCPYCDFNSHGLRGSEDFVRYTECLLADLALDLEDFAAALAGRKVVSVFFGGGTPSLFAPDLVAHFLRHARRMLPFVDDCEITLETNPGTVEYGRFEDYLAAGVNRLSLGVQSFSDDKLKRLGRIHSAREAIHAIELAQRAGYTNFNLDLMYALPRQSLDEALFDVHQAMALAPTHISHYQLTLEPNTAFAAHPPPLPDDDSAWDMQEACQDALAAGGYRQYEISAYARQGHTCRHNYNYWSFGDYLGIGAGAHGKISSTDTILRRAKRRMPLAFMKQAESKNRVESERIVSAEELPFEYMLNALRLIDGTAMDAFSVRTGLGIDSIASLLDTSRRNGWLSDSHTTLQTTPLGQRFLNDVISLFMGDASARKADATAST